MTWNVHGTLSLNPGFDLPGVIALIQKWQPDIVGLQEIDSRGRTDDPFGLLEDALGGHSIGAKSIVTADGHYGQMLISRWPWCAAPEIADISYPEREPRRAIAADVQTPFGQLRVISTHLGLSVRERHTQTATLVRLSTPDRVDQSGAPRRSPTVLLGDFNDWFWINSVRKALAAHLPVRTAQRTFPSRWPLMKLDRIYGQGIRIIQSRVDISARALSDHLPVIADVALDVYHPL